MSTESALQEVRAERLEQNIRFGQQNHPDGTGRHGDILAADWARSICDRATEAKQVTYRDILHEEVCEAYAETDPARLRAELVQVAAVAVAWIEAIDRRGK